MMSRAKLILTILIIASALSACGIKPGNLTPPAGDREDLFPRAYPKDPSKPQVKSINR